MATSIRIPLRSTDHGGDLLSEGSKLFVEHIDKSLHSLKDSKAPSAFIHQCQKGDKGDNNLTRDLDLHLSAPNGNMICNGGIRGPLLNIGRS